MCLSGLKLKNSDPTCVRPRGYNFYGSGRMGQGAVRMGWVIFFISQKKMNRQKLKKIPEKFKINRKFSNKIIEI
jgi:hypothetical protein